MESAILEPMLKITALVAVLIGAAALAIWRGVAMYRYTFHKKNL